MTRRALALCALVACHAAVRPPAPDARLWAAAEVIGDGRGHLPLPALALVALPGDRALEFTDDGGLAEVDLATAQVTRARLAALDGEVRAAVLLRGGRVLAVGGRDGRPAAWWISPRELTARVAPLPGAGTSPLTGVAVSPDGRAVVVTGPTWPLVLRDPQTLAERGVVSAQRGFDDPQFIGDYLAVNGSGALIVFDPAHDARAIGRIAGVGFVSADGAAVVVDGGSATLVDLHGGPATTPDLGTAPVAGVAWSPSGDRAALIRGDAIELIRSARWPAPTPADPRGGGAGSVRARWRQPAGHAGRRPVARRPRGRGARTGRRRGGDRRRVAGRGGFGVRGGARSPGRARARGDRGRTSPSWSRSRRAARGSRPSTPAGQLSGSRTPRPAPSARCRVAIARSRWRSMTTARRWSRAGRR